MKTTHSDDVTIYVGDNRQTLKEIPPQSAQACITSPPYYNLRNYQHADQIGNEKTPEEFIAELVDVFSLVRNVLKDDGTLWLNLGDCYHKGQLLGIPWRVALALKSDGWFLRQEIIWSKPNPNPESCTNRPTRAHETIFLFAKSAKYYYNGDPLREPWKDNPIDIKRATEKHQGYNGKHAEGYAGNIKGQPVGDPSKGRNKRTVWEVSAARFRGAHFATFPVKLIETCILAGCPEEGTVLDPFAGAATTAVAARLLNRKSILCELNPEYVELQKIRLDSIQKPLIQTT